MKRHFTSADSVGENPTYRIKLERKKTRKGVRKINVRISSRTTAATLKAIAEALHKTFWYQRTVPEGAKGPIVYEFSRREVLMELFGDGTLAQVHLLLRRTLGPNPEYRFFICNAPSHVRLKTLVWLSGMRWAIEQVFGEGKTELGMDHYEVRKRTGWHHHMMACMVTLLFLLHLMVRLEKKAPQLTLSQTRILIQHLVPLLVLTVEQLLEKVRHSQCRNHAARKSHAKKKLELYASL